MNLFSNITSKYIKSSSNNLKFITKAIINNENNKFSIKLIEDGINDDIIKDMNSRLEIYDKLYDTNTENLTALSNKTVNNKLKSIEKKYKEEITLLKNKVKSYEEDNKEEMQKYIEHHNKTNEEKYKLSIELEKNKVKEKFHNEIKKRDIEIIQLKQELDNINNLVDIDKTLNHRFNAFNKYFDGRLSTQDKGNAGEEHLLNHIKKLIEMSDGHIEKVSGEANAGDLFMTFKNMKCCVESKNHSKTISSNELNRFLYTDVQHARYNCGLFISHKSGFPNSSGIKHFEVKIEQNKPCIFLSNIQDNMGDIALAIKILNFLLTIDYNVDKLNIINQLKQDLRTFKELEDINNNNIKNLSKACKIIEIKYKEISDILDIQDDNLISSGKKRKRNSN